MPDLLVAGGNVCAPLVTRSTVETHSQVAAKGPTTLTQFGRTSRPLVVPRRCPKSRMDCAQLGGR
jgi:hypothetical protein